MIQPVASAGGMLAAVYAVGVVIAVVRTDASGPARLGLALLWPVGPLAFVATVTVLLLASLVAFPVFGAIVVGLALAAAAFANPMGATHPKPAAQAHGLALQLGAAQPTGAPRAKSGPQPNAGAQPIGAAESIGAAQTNRDALPNVAAQRIGAAESIGAAQTNREAQPNAAVHPIADAQPIADPHRSADAHPIVDARSNADAHPNAVAQPGPGAQNAPALQARFIGNMAYAITDGTVTLFTDFPYESGYSVYMEYDPREIRSPATEAIALVTHRHRDHWDPGLFARTDWRVVAPADALADVPAARILRALPVVPARVTLTSGPIAIEALPTPHANIGHYSYLVTWHGRRLYFTGDTDSPDQLLAMRNLDVAFVSPWLYERAARGGRRIDATRVVIYHQTADDRIPGCRDRCRVPSQGETLTF